MELHEAQALEHDLDKMKSCGGKNSREELAQGWVTPYHQEFLELVGNNKRQWFITWGSVLNTEGDDPDMPLDEILYAAETRIATPTQTAGRLSAKLDQGWPEKVLKAIVEKTLDAGITVKHIKQSQGDVVRFAPSLASDWGKIPLKKKQEALATNNFVSTPKMDGLRCLFKVNTHDEGVYSRSLKPLKNMNTHLQALKKMFKGPAILDGEALAADGSWNSSMTGSKKEGAKVPMLFYPFDYIPYEEQETGIYKTPAAQRHAILNHTLDYGDESLFVQVVQTPVKTVADVVEAHRLDLEDGWEGSVLHNLDAPYACKRTRAWIKVKAWQSSEFMITGFVAGRGKHLGRLGTILVEGNVNGLPVKCEVGTGFSDAEREELWNNQSQYLHRWAEIKYFEVTADQSLRFPSFLRFRSKE